MLRQFVLAFRNEVGRKKHLQAMLKRKNFTINFSSGQEQVCLKLTDRKIVVCSSDCSVFDMTITGPAENLISLLKGEVKLREAEKMHEVVIDATFRSSLFAESLFYLGKTKK